MSELSKPRIVCAANRHHDSGEIVIGVRHFCPLMHQNIEGLLTPFTSTEYEFRWRKSEQGFIDQHGAFYTREAAWKIAEANGQIIRDPEWQTGSLRSEHLY